MFKRLNVNKYLCNIKKECVFEKDSKLYKKMQIKK